MPISFRQDVWEHSCLARELRELWQVGLLQSDLWFGRTFCKNWLRDDTVAHSENRPLQGEPRNTRKRSNQANSRADIAGKS
jgi:hypothetical protein